MPRDGSGVYSPPPGSNEATPNTTILSSLHNALVNDLTVDANAARPVTAGGTGATTAAAAYDALSKQASSVASASTTDIGGASGRNLHITGTTTITSLGTAAAGIVREVVFDGALTLTHNGTSLILPGASNIATGAGDTALFVSEGSGNWRCLSYQRADSLPARVIRRQTFIASGTYTPHAKMVFCLVEAQGGGGGGGGATGSTGFTFGGAGGGAGSCANKALTRAQVGTSQTVTIGSGGAGGVGSNAGGAGGDSSLGSLCVGKGGGGGAFAAAGSPGTAPLGGGSGTGDFTVPGEPGFSGVGMPHATNNSYITGRGGSSKFGTGARGVLTITSTSGEAPLGYGCGGGGGLIINGTTSASGSAGGGGCVIVTEFCSE